VECEEDRCTAIVQLVDCLLARTDGLTLLDNRSWYRNNWRGGWNVHCTSI